MKIKEYLAPKKRVSKIGAYLSILRRTFASLYNFSALFFPFFKLFDFLYRKKIMRILRKISNKSEFEPDLSPKCNVEKGTIFYLWWDGFDNLPPICKICYNSIIKNANGHEIVFLDKNNYKKYINIPDYIVDKFEKGCFSKTLLSDVIRLLLLSTYDCVWLDATMYLLRPIPEYLFEKKFCSCNSKKIIKDINDSTMIVNEHFPVYFFISKSGYIFKDVVKILCNYWLKYNDPLDYFLTNYVFEFVVENNKEYKRYIQSMDEICPRVEWLLKNMNNKYDENELLYITKETFMFKLTWKNMNTFSNVDSYYSYVMNENDI